MGDGRNPAGFWGLANQRDAEPALRFRVDFSAKAIQDIHNVLHFEIGVEWVSEDRVENFALMVIHGRPQSGFDEIWATMRRRHHSHRRR